MKEKEKEMMEINGSYKLKEEEIKSKYKQDYLAEENRGRKELEDMRNKALKEMQELSGAHAEKMGELSKCENVQDMIALKLLKSYEKDKVNIEDKLEIMKKYNLIGNKKDSSKMNAVPPNYYNYPNNQPYMYNPNFTPGFPMNNFQFPMYNYNQFPMNAQVIYPPQQNPYYNMQQQFEKPTKRGKKKREDNAPSTAADTNP